MKPFAGISGRSGGWSEEGCTCEVRRVFHQPDERRRIACDPDDLHLAALDAQLRHIGMVRQNLRQGFKHDHTGSILVFPPIECLLRSRGTTCRISTLDQRGTAL